MDSIHIGCNVALPLKTANRHGLITGATGTGKTVTLQLLAEGFSAAGVPVFAADIKGDLSGVATRFPVAFWDLFGERGMPVRATVHEMGPLVLARMLQLNETQEGVLNVAFRLAAEEDTPLMDLTDLRAMMVDLSERAADLRVEYGNITPASVGTITRQLLVLEGQGGNLFFGEPALDIRDFIRTGADGNGTINLLAAERLMDSPRLYASFLLWLLTSLFEVLPEAGDLDKPKMVFIFDEAHMLFSEAPKRLIEVIERVVRLIRSKGVGVYFVTQNPLDVPDKVLGQLGFRAQHALRAFSPRDQRAVRAAAETFRQNPEIDTAEVITRLGVGEALVSVLAEDGTPTMVERVKVNLPSAQIGPIPDDMRARLIGENPLNLRYGVQMDHETAFSGFLARVDGKRPETACQPSTLTNP